MKQIILDGNILADAAKVHDYLMKMLDFPEYYGANLDALYDCLSEIGEDTHLQLHNWHHIEFHLKDYSGKALYVFHCACRENEHLTVTLHP